MIKKKYFLFSVILILLVLSFSFSAVSAKNNDFNLDSVLIKVTMSTNSQFIKEVEITNNLDKSQDISFSFDGLDNMAYLSENNLNFQPGEKKRIELNFNDYNGLVDTYIGEFIVESENSKKEIPIILNVKDEKDILAVTQNQLLQYGDVYPGGKFGVEIKIFDLQNNPSSQLKIKYVIKSFDGKEILSSEENVVIEDSITLTKVFDIPSSAQYGDYVLVTYIESNGNLISSSQIFNVTGKNNGLFGFDFNYLIIIVVILFIIALLYFIYFIKTRDKLIIQLQSQQKNEINNNLRLIEDQKRKLASSKLVGVKNKKIKDLEKSKRRIIYNLKKKHREQIKKLKKLRSSKKKKKAKSSIEKWKNQGYHMSEAKKELKLSKKDVDSKLSQWKKEGFDIGILK